MAECAKSELLTDEDRARYQRHMMIAGWGEAGQQKVKAARVFVAGAGGLGSPASMYLAVAGVGRLVICDFDTPELSNLNRQILHNDSRIGMNKAESAKLTLEQLNPSIEVEAISTRMPALTIGPGTDPASQMGPLITAEHRDKVASYVAGAADEGATVVVDGREHEFDSNGFFIGVSLIDHVKPGMKVYDDEIFGPVLSVVRVETYADAVKLVNDNEFGNGVAIFTRDGGAARQFEFDVEAGMVGVNVPIPVPVGTFSFGGWKNSLFGDTHMYGPESIRFYTRGKVVTTRWPDPSTSVIDLGFPQVD